ncbi:MAG: hypothetical protein IAX21_05910 [Candidatus Bathyarchaeota archaeon]|nr:hypothetical protein [Candidatus Bathyarchaeum tardum]WGM89511.1 MAG: hypothetical protein NUK63_11535 [Candidatus Bathyarchaeum tardum]WNZ28218.1 MAG: hypothetical protein IAX21_05910 [Candidatus Bathyarchaeota archaeon]
MPKKSPAIICPNPKCGKEIEESVMLNILSVTPPKKYEACPYCFSELDKEAIIKKEKGIETSKKPEEPRREEIKESVSGVFDKVKSLIPNSKDRNEEIQEKPTFKKEKPREDYSNKKEKEKSSKTDTKSGCPERFGYLANRPNDEPIPQYCLTCPKMVDCMLSPKEE